MKLTDHTHRRRFNIKNRFLAAVIIAVMAFPFTSSQADTAREGIGKVYESAIGLLNGIAISSAKTPRAFLPQTFETPSQRALQVTRLRLCPRRLVLYADETFTLAPLPFNNNREIIHSVHQTWESTNSTVAQVSSVGEVIAIAPGQADVAVQVGTARASVAVEVREGIRPVQSDSEYDLEHASDCDEPESSQLRESKPDAGPQRAEDASSGTQIEGSPAIDRGDLSKRVQPVMLQSDGSKPSRAIMSASAMAARAGKAASPAQNIGLIEGDGGDTSSPAAAAYNNAIGSPRFAAQLLSETGGIKTRKILGSYNYGVSIPVLGLGGRGIGVDLALTYNSQLWTKDSGKMTFNYNKGWPTFGWSLGYGRIIKNYDNSATGNGSGQGQSNAPGNRLLTEFDGTRTHLQQTWDSVAQKWTFNSINGTFLHLTGLTGKLRYPGGTEVNYEEYNNRLLPLSIRNTNGDMIKIQYVPYDPNTFKFRWAIQHIEDSLGRNIVFNYDPNSGVLTSITAPGPDGNPRTLVQIDYQTVTLKYQFVSSLAVTAPPSDTAIEVVRRVYYPQTGRGYIFSEYSTYGMARRVAMNIGMTATNDGTEVSYTRYNYTTLSAGDPDNQVGSLDDSPQYTERKEWWQGKTDDNGLPTSNPTAYAYSRVKDTVAHTETHTETEVLHNLKALSIIDINPASISQGAVKSVVFKDASENELRRTNYFYVGPPDGGLQVSVVQSINELGQLARVIRSYGNYGRVTQVSEQDFSSVTQRTSKYFYIDNSDYLDRRMLQLIKRVEVYDANNTMVAKTVFDYDNYAVMGGMEFYNMPTNPFPPNHVASFDQNFTIRGNVTGVETFSSINPAVSITRNSKYDIFGNVVEAQVNCCGVKTARFGTTGGSATLYSQPDFTTDGRDGITPFLKTSYQYNLYTGLVSQITNEDGQITTFEYDAALRPFRVISPTGATSETKFDQAANGTDLLAYTEKVSYTDADGLPKIITTKSWFDGAGRILRSGNGQGSSPTSYDAVKQVYDSLGRLIRQSNPYLGNSSGDGSPQHWTVSTYDDLGRVTDTTLPDGQIIQTDYNGVEAISTDEVGRKRKSEADALGRLIKVTEQDPATGNLSVVTTYSYDALDNLTQVNQGGQTRSFQYDALSRLVSQSTPEAGAVAFTYTDFDAVLKRVDARNVETHYAYDSLNRLKQVWYTGLGGNDSGTVRPPLPSGVEQTADVIIQYKTTAPGNGQVNQVADGAGQETYSYDVFGRQTSTSRIITGSSATYTTSYEYNQIGQPTAMIYPSTKRMRANYDQRGRLVGLDKMNGSAVELSYISQMSYNVAWQLTSSTLGNGVVESFGYSPQRLQLTSQSATKGAVTLMNLTYNYSASAGANGAATTAGNSGQLMSVNGVINGQTRNQAFTYDNVRRLKTSTGWTVGQARRYEYDRWGNRTGMWDSTSGGNQLQSVILQQPTGVPNNRIASVNGLSYVYDNVGNLTNDGEHSYSYDAENRLVKVDNGSTAAYSYDSANQRVKRQTAQGTTYYIWEGGVVIAEYVEGQSPVAGGLKYYLADRLSTRMTTDSTGSVLGTQDHLPFGEEAGTFGGVEKHQFTNYERDDETGTDYGVNRQYSHKTGRFMRPDPVAGSISDSQSLNRYGYVGNDPVNAIDPLGLFRVCFFSVETVNVRVQTNDGPKTIGTAQVLLFEGCSDFPGISPIREPREPSISDRVVRVGAQNKTPNQGLADCYNKALYAYRAAGRTSSQSIVDWLKFFSPTGLLSAGVGASESVNAERQATRDYRFGVPKGKIAKEGIKGGFKGFLGAAGGVVGRISGGLSIIGLSTVVGDAFIGREAFLREAITECNEAFRGATDKVDPAIIQVPGRSNVDNAQSYVDKYLKP